MVSDFVYGNTPPEIVKAFRDGLRELGRIEGQGLVIEHRHAASVQQRNAIAAELSRNPPDVAFLCPPCAAWAKPSGSAPIQGVPMVFLYSDPVAGGLVKSLAQPGGPMTGVAYLGIELNVKRLELLKETIPNLTRVGVLVTHDHRLRDRMIAEITDAATRWNIKLQLAEIAMGDTAEKVDAAFEAFIRAGAEAVLVLQGPHFYRERSRITALSLKYRLPGLMDAGEGVETGAFMTYDPNFIDLTRRAASYVDKILRGVKPAELPVEQPNTFSLGINLRTAKALGIAVPRSILLRADRVIE